MLSLPAHIAIMVRASEAPKLTLEMEIRTYTALVGTPPRKYSFCVILSPRSTEKNCANLKYVPYVDEPAAIRDSISPPERTAIPRTCVDRSFFWCILYQSPRMDGRNTTIARCSEDRLV